MKRKLHGYSERCALDNNQSRARRNLSYLRSGNWTYQSCETANHLSYVFQKPSFEPHEKNKSKKPKSISKSKLPKKGEFSGSQQCWCYRRALSCYARVEFCHHRGSSPPLVHSGFLQESQHPACRSFCTSNFKAIPPCSERNATETRQKNSREAFTARSVFSCLGQAFHLVLVFVLLCPEIMITETPTLSGSKLIGTLTALTHNRPSCMVYVKHVLKLLFKPTYL